MSGFKAVYCKEMKRVFKEPKMIFSIFLLPVILMIGIYGLVGFMTNNMINDIQAHRGTVVINHLPDVLEADFSDFIGNNDVQLINDGSSIPDDGLTQQIREGELDLYVSFPEDFIAQTEAGNSPDIHTFYNPSEEYSSTVRENFLSVLNSTVYNKLLAERLGDLSVLNVFTVDANNNAGEILDEQRASGQMLSMLIPYIIVVLLFSGTMSLGVDTIAGEKERGTMASLLLTPVSRMSIMMGKLLSLTTLSMLSSCIYIIALVIAMPMTMQGMIDSNVSMTPLQIVMIAVMMLVLAAFFVAVISLLAVIAKSVKEASSYVSPIYILVIVAGLLTMFSMGDHKTWEYAVPVYGSALGIGQIFTNELTVVNFLINIVSTVIFTAIISKLVASAFNSEKLMFNA